MYKINYYILFEHIEVGDMFTGSSLDNIACMKLSETEYSKDGSEKVFTVDKEPWLVELLT
jgi:hypothetical protein